MMGVFVAADCVVGVVRQKSCTLSWVTLPRPFWPSSALISGHAHPLRRDNLSWSLRTHTCSRKCNSSAFQSGTHTQVKQSMLSRDCCNLMSSCKITHSNESNTSTLDFNSVRNQSLHITAATCTRIKLRSDTVSWEESLGCYWPVVTVPHGWRNQENHSQTHCKLLQMGWPSTKSNTSRLQRYSDNKFNYR